MMSEHESARCLCDHGQDVHTGGRCLSSLTGSDHLPCGCPGFKARPDIDLEAELAALRDRNEALKRELRRYKEEVKYEVCRAANAVLAAVNHAETTVEDEMARRTLRKRRDKEGGGDADRERAGR